MPYPLETAWTISTMPPAGNLAVRVFDNAGVAVPGVVLGPVISRGGPTYTALVSNIPDTLTGYVQVVNTISNTPISIRGISPSDAPGGGSGCDSLMCVVASSLSPGYAGGGSPTTMADYIHAICNGRRPSLCHGGGGGGGACCGGGGGGGACCSTPITPHCHQECVTNTAGVPLAGVTVEMYTDPGRVNRVAVATTDANGIALLCHTVGGTFYVFKTLVGYTFTNPTVVVIP